MKSNPLPDVQNSKSSIPLSIQKVGVKQILRQIKMIRKDVGEIVLNAKINAFIDLPPYQRGIHMSRSPEAIEETIEETSHSPISCIEELPKRIVIALLKKHEYANRAEVLVESSYNQKSEIFSKVIAERYEDGVNLRLWVGASAMGISACPCAQEIIKDLSKQLLSEKLNIQEDKINEILQLIPIASHNQRSKGIVFLEVPEENYVDILSLINTIESSFSATTSEILKRSDEAKLVKDAHFNPKFVEDTVRYIAKNLIEKFDIPDEMDLQIKVENYESIHSYDAYAEIRSTIWELRKQLS